MSFCIRKRKKLNSVSMVGYSAGNVLHIFPCNHLRLQMIVTCCLMLILTACGQKNASTNTQQSIDSPAITKSASGKKIILFFGDSLTAGYGLDDPSEAFPGVIQRKIDSLKLPYLVVNAGVSGETTAGGLGRIDWILKQKVDVFVLELGANDGLRGIPVKATAENLEAITGKVKTRYPNARLVLVGMQVPPSMGADYVTGFKEIFPKIAEKNKMALVPFLLTGVGGIAKLNQPDGIHPTAEGAKIAAGNVWNVLKEQL